jgi:N-acetylglucosamine-6-phosphate deacetylase
MTSLVLFNTRIITPNHIIPNGWVYIVNQKISAIGIATPPTSENITHIDLMGQTLAPGFIDVHVHGAMNCETMDGTSEALETMSKFYVQHGVTSYLPTTLTDTHERILKALDAVKITLKNPPSHASTILGVHLEGPYLNREKAGAQNPQHIRLVDKREIAELLEFGVLRLVAIAPEFTENEWLIDECVQRGITVSIAHTNASYETTLKAIQRGISHATHTYNAMTPLQHRNPGVVGAVLSEPTVRCEVISDWIHVHPGAVRVLYQAKGKHNTMIITDAMRACGMPDGEYTIGDMLTRKQDGKVTLVNDNTLAGSVAVYDECVQKFVKAVGKPFEEIWQVTSLTPAQAIGEAHQRGSIEIGKIADLVVLDADLNVLKTIVSGVIAYER